MQSELYNQNSTAACCAAKKECMVKPLNQLVATYAVQAAKFHVGIMSLHITELAVGLAQDTERSTRLPSAKAAMTSDQRQGIYTPRHMIRFPRGKADSCLLAKQPPLEKDIGLVHREGGPRCAS